MENAYQYHDGMQEASDYAPSRAEMLANERALEAQVAEARAEEDQYADHLAARIIAGETALLPTLAATVLRLQDLKGGHGYGWRRIMSDLRIRLYLASGTGIVPAALFTAIRGAAQQAWLDYRAESPAVIQAWCQLPSGEIVSGRALELLAERRVAARAS